MEELSSSKPVVHVSPIWPKRRKRKSFKKSANILVKVLRFIHQSNCTVEVIDLANESQRREERLEKLKGLAKCKDDGPGEETKKNGWTLYREKMRYLHYLERMSNGLGKHNKPHVTKNVAAFGTLQQFKQENSESPIWMKRLKTSKKVNERKPTEFSSADQPIPGKGKCSQSVHPNNIPKRAAMKSQLSSLDAKLDPRFQNLLCSLTPIDC